jgi:hypothetical protein
MVAFLVDDTGCFPMTMVVNVSTQAPRGQQAMMEAAFTDAGILQVPSTAPTFYLTAADDLKDLATIAGNFRCKPRIMEASEEDVPDADANPATTEELIEFVHHLGYSFNWDEETQLWCVSGVHDGYVDETADAFARDEREAVIEALRHLVS